MLGKLKLRHIHAMKAQHNMTKNHKQLNSTNWHPYKVIIRPQIFDENLISYKFLTHKH